MNPMALVGGAALTANFLSSSNSKDIARTRDHDIGYNFMVMISFGVIGEFQSLGGMGREVDFEALQEGGRTGGPHMRLKHGKPGSMTLKFGMMDRSYMWDWMEVVRIGYDFRREVTILQFNQNYSLIRNFNVTEAFPTSIKSGSLDAMSSTFPVDEITLYYEKVIPIIIPQSLDAALSNAVGIAAGIQI